MSEPQSPGGAHPAGTAPAGPARTVAPRDAAGTSALGGPRDGSPDPAASPPAPGAPLVNVANAVTVARLLLVPAFLAALLADGGHRTTWRVVAAVVFAVASVTDRIDGSLARRRNLVTDFGKVADPIADKALTGAALIGLSTLGAVPSWVTAVVLARELGVTGLRFWVIRHGVIPASRGGKLKTLLQGLAIELYVLPLTGWPASLRAAVLCAAVVVTLGTGADYVARAVVLRRTSARTLARRALAPAGGEPVPAPGVTPVRQERRDAG